MNRPILQLQLSKSPTIRPHVALIPSPSSRLSREPTIDDDYRLRKLAAAVAEMRQNGSTTVGQRGQSVGERTRLPEGQEAREESLFQLLSQLESADSLARAMASLEGSSSSSSKAPAPASLGESGRPASNIRGAATPLSASFQRRASALCRDRADTSETAEAEAGLGGGAGTGGAVSPQGVKDKSAPAKNKEAVSMLRFRAAAHELYTLLESVELQPAGAAGEDGDGDPAFLPPGKRGWKHALLCEEAVGWVDMVREAGGARGVPLSSAQLPEFQVRPAKKPRWISRSALVCAWSGRHAVLLIVVFGDKSETSQRR